MAARNVHCVCSRVLWGEKKRKEKKKCASGGEREIQKPCLLAVYAAARDGRRFKVRWAAEVSRDRLGVAAE